MRKTVRGRVLGAAAIVLFLVGYLFSSIAPSLLGLALLGYLVFARIRFAALLSDLHVAVERHAPEATPFQDEPITLRADLAVGPPGLWITVELARDAELVPESVEATIRHA